MAMAEAFKRLDRLMDQRRVELRMSWRDVAHAARISEAALRTIRRGRHVPTDLTAARIDDAVQWSPGTVKRVLAGGGAEGDQVDAQEIRDALQAAVGLDDPEEMRAALQDLLARIPPVPEAD